MIFLAIIVGVFIYNAKDNWPFGLPGIAIFIAFLWFFAYRSIKQQQAIWESIKIEVGDDYIARQQIRIPQIRINRGEVTAVWEVGNGLCILTADKFRSLSIPKELDSPDYEEIKSALSTWANIQPKSRGAQIKNTALTIMLLIGIGIIFLSTSAWLVLAAGLAVIPYSTFFFLQLPRHKGIDPKLRRTWIIGFGLLLLITGSRLYFLFAGY
jgi:hypothetical protein